MTQPAQILQFDAMPVAIFAGAAPVTLYDVLHQAYGAAADTFKHVQIGYFDANYAAGSNFSYWDPAAKDITSVLLNGSYIAGTDAGTAAAGHMVMTPVANSDFKNVQFDLGNNIFPNIYVEVDIGTDPKHPVYQELNITIVPEALRHSGPFNGAPTPDQMVAMADLFNTAYGHGRILNVNDCHWIAADIAAAIGAPFDPMTQSTDPALNQEAGFWRIAYTGYDQGAVSNWQTLVQPGDIVRMNIPNQEADHTVTVLKGPNAHGEIFVLDNGGGMIQERWVNFDNRTDPSSVTIYRLAADHMYLINGSDQSETLYGTVYNDRMIGGAGDDTYYVNNPSDQVVEYTWDYVWFDPLHDVIALAGGNDTIVASVNYALPDYVENITLAEGSTAYEAEGNDQANVLTGNSGGNYLEGDGGNDQLNGKGGYDTLIGGEGDDQYFLADAQYGGWFGGLYDRVVEDANGGIDTVNVRAAAYHASGMPNLSWTTSYTLPDNVENAVIEGDRAFSVVGNELSNTIYGNVAANTIDGRGGADTMIGWAGDDIYYVDHVGDQVSEHQFDAVNGHLVAGGNDTIISSVDYRALPDFVENLTLKEGSNAHAALGNGLANIIIGNSLANVINGGASADTMTGGKGADTFVFSKGDGSDKITDFTIGEDHLDLHMAGVTSFSQLAVSHTRSGDAVITYDSVGDSITLNHVTETQVRQAAASIFQFAKLPGQTFDGTAAWGSSITGTAGIDALTYATQKAGVYVDLVRDGGFSELARIESDGSRLHGHMTGIENVTGATDYMNGLLGDDKDNILTGGNASNWFEGRGGNNTLIGGASIDYADYAAATGPVTIDLGAGKAYHEGYVDTLVSIEAFRGSYNSDTFIGGKGNDYYNDLGGHDTIYGNEGDDVLDGYAGDTINGGAGKDRLGASSGDDLLTGGTEADTFLFRDGSLGRHEITDFNPYEGDRISFSDYTVPLNLRYGDDGHGNAMLTYATRFGDGTIVLDHVDPNAMHSHPEWFA